MRVNKHWRWSIRTQWRSSVRLDKRREWNKWMKRNIHAKNSGEQWKDIHPEIDSFSLNEKTDIISNSNWIQYRQPKTIGKNNAQSKTKQ